MPIFNGDCSTICIAEQKMCWNFGPEFGTKCSHTLWRHHFVTTINFEACFFSKYLSNAGLVGCNNCHFKWFFVRRHSGTVPCYFFMLCIIVSWLKVPQEYEFFLELNLCGSSMGLAVREGRTGSIKFDNGLGMNGLIIFVRLDFGVWSPRLIPAESWVNEGNSGGFQFESGLHWHSHSGVWRTDQVRATPDRTPGLSPGSSPCSRTQIIKVSRQES